MIQNTIVSEMSQTGRQMLSQVSELTEHWRQLLGGADWFAGAGEYGVDAVQRTVLFWDILRKRGNMYLTHLEEGMPPVLVFPYELVMDGRILDRPVNYALVRIIDRRKAETLPAKDKERRKQVRAHTPEKQPRPIVVIDPRAGHGPGIGGSKQNSEIGMALDAGHPVYFILFYPRPQPGQTLADVVRAQIIFLERVAEEHPGSDKPGVIGNCQAGWAAALIGASRPETVGPLVLNGSPLSYWGGVEGSNPMRYRGGLFGGVWLTSLTSDLGNGRFDGAHLVAGFEDLNPANTLWAKLYHLYANLDTEEARFLNFEKWWNGFYLMNAEEIHFIVNNLFIGNRLESGELDLGDGSSVNLKKIKEPILIFASRGDNITPPQQALNWIIKVYKSAEEIRKSGQVIVYIIHEKIGHLGIFVSSSVARKEHKQIIGSFEMLDYLSPGLYEMVIQEERRTDGPSHFSVRFEARETEHILGLDDGLEDEESFRPVDTLSRINDGIYRTLVQPWVKTATTEATAELWRQMHPLRFTKYLFSDLNPFMAPVRAMSGTIRENRRPVSPDNPFSALEADLSRQMVQTLDLFRDIRDMSQEYFFKSMYGNIWMKWLFPVPQEEKAGGTERDEAADAARLKKEAGSGEFAEAAVRVIMAILNADRVFDRRGYEAAEKAVLAHAVLRKIPAVDMKKTAKQQSMLLDADEDLALTALPRLLKTKKSRKDVLALAKKVLTDRNAPPGGKEYAVYKRIREILS